MIGRQGYINTLVMMNISHENTAKRDDDFIKKPEDISIRINSDTK